MNYSIRLYQPADFTEIKRWYSVTEEGSPNEDMYPVGSTLLVEANGAPIMCLALYLTNCKEVCYLEGWIGNPDFTSSERKEASELLAEEACSHAQQLGYKNVVTFSYRDKVKDRITALGFARTLDNLSSFVRGLA